MKQVILIRPHPVPDLPAASGSGGAHFHSGSSDVLSLPHSQLCWGSPWDSIPSAWDGALGIGPPICHSRRWAGRC